MERKDENMMEYISITRLRIAGIKFAKQRNKNVMEYVSITRLRTACIGLIRKTLINCINQTNAVEKRWIVFE